MSGAASGIGQASAVRLGEEGAQLIIADRSNADETLRLIKDIGGKARAVRCDVSDPASVAALNRRFKRRATVVTFSSMSRAFIRCRPSTRSHDDWRRVLSVNLDSMFSMTKAFADGMRRRRWGRIVNFTSDTVSLVVPGFAHYIASKAGVIGSTRALATEFGHDGITAKLIAPGQTVRPAR